MEFNNLESFVDALIFEPIEKRELLVNKFIGKNKVPIIENQNKVHFIYFGKASKVVISGDLQNGWSKGDELICINCGSSNFFYKTYEIPSNSRVDYKFEVDGNHINDPRNPLKIPSGYGFNSELAMPDFSRNQTLIFNSEIKHGFIETLNLNFKENSIKERELKIYLPFDYDNIFELPCIYVLDGDDMLNFACYKNILDNCIHSGKIEPIAAVFIPTKERSEEYLNAKKESLMKVLIEELVPEIERRYKVAKNPQKRALHGISAGGYYALCSVIKHPELFQNVAAQSSAIKSKLFSILSQSVKNGKIPPTSKIYFDVGRFDLEVYNYDIPWIFIDVNRKFRFELQKYGIAHKYQEFNDGHSWANWRERIEDILIYFFGG